MASRVDRLEKKKRKAEAKGKTKKAANISKKIDKSKARQEDRGKRKSGEETRLMQRQRKTYAAAQKALKEGKGKKALRKLKKTAQQQSRMKRRNKGETGIYPIIQGFTPENNYTGSPMPGGGTTYGGKVKTSGLRKLFKKNR